MHQSIVTMPPPPQKVGYNGENVQGFYFCIVPGVLGKHQGFVF